MSIDNQIIWDIISSRSVWEALGSKGKTPDKPFLAWLRGRPCAACGQMAVEGVLDVVPHHVRRVGFSEGGSGVGMKPSFSSVPLCVRCHDKVEGDGCDRDIADEKSWIEWRLRYPTQWAGERLLETMGVQVFGDIQEGNLGAWLIQNDIRDVYLPVEV